MNDFKDNMSSDNRTKIKGLNNYIGKDTYNPSAKTGLRKRKLPMLIAKPK